MLDAAATVFVVADVAAARNHYRDIFGFDVAFEYGTPPTYVCFCRDQVQLHLRAPGPDNRRPGHGHVCIFVADVDALHAELAARGAHLPNPPEDRPYAMRDFDHQDPDGNRITYGMSTAPHD